MNASAVKQNQYIRGCANPSHGSSLLADLRLLRNNTPDVSGSRRDLAAHKRAISSAGERPVHTGKVAGSSPASPTTTAKSWVSAPPVSVSGGMHVLGEKVK